MLTQTGSAAVGDRISLYYNRQAPKTAVSDETFEIQKRTFLRWILIFGVALAAVVVIRIIVRAVTKGSSKEKTVITPQRDIASQNDITPQRGSVAYRSVSSRSGDPILEKREFWTAFFQSMEYKNAGMLTSALRERERALAMVEDEHDY